MQTTTTNLTYARNDYIKKGYSHTFDTVGDMLYYILTNNDIAATYTNTITVGVDGAGHDVKFFGDTSTCYWLWDQSADEVVLAGRIRFLVDASRTGEGSCLFANGVSIGMATPGDCQGVKMEFDYGVAPTVSGDGKGVVGLDIKMTMDQDWDFGTKQYNATVRAARLQVVSEDDVSGKIEGAYINAIASGTSKTIEGYISGLTGPGIIGIEARTELASSATITSPAAAGILVFHYSKASSVLTGGYRGLQIEMPLMGSAASISSTTYGIYLGADYGGADVFDYGLYITAGTSTMGISCQAPMEVGVDDTGYDVKFFGATASCYWLWDESADEVVLAGRINFVEDPGRTGEGTFLFANGLSIGMATPGDCQGIKMEFDYGVAPTLTGGGKGIHGLDIKMTMDQEWNFSSADRNATVRGARIQGWSQDDVGGKTMGIYSNARAEGTSKTVEGIIGGTDDGPGVVSIEARTELGSSATITTPAVVGLEVWHNSKTSSELTGDYRAICIHQPLMPTITGTMYGVWFGDDHNTGYPFDYIFGFSSELDLDQACHYAQDSTASGMSFSTCDGWIKVEIDGNPVYLYVWDVKPA